MPTVQTSRISELLASGGYREVIAELHPVVSQPGADPQDVCDLGLAFLQAREFSAASLCFESVLERRNEDSAAFLGLAKVRFHQADSAEARRLCEALPADPEAQVLLGQIHEQAAEYEEAQAAYHAATLLIPDFGDAMLGLARLGQLKCPEDLEARLDQCEFEADEEALLRGAVAQAFEDQGQHARALANALRGKALTRRPQGAEGSRADTVVALTAAMEGETSTSTEEPIFLIGARCSGGSRIERMLARYPGVHAVGERNDGLKLASRMVAADALTPEQLDELAAEYWQGLAPLPNGVRHPIDWTPANLQLVGYLARMFPRAIFVHVHRDPRDVAVSQLLTSFGHLRVPESTSIRNVARSLRDAQRLAAHWRSQAQVRFVDVEYEALTQDPEGVMEPVLTELGLDWDPRCLEPESRVDPPFHSLRTNAVGRWHRHPALFTSPDWIEEWGFPTSLPMSPTQSTQAQELRDEQSLLRQAKSKFSGGDHEGAAVILIDFIAKDRQQPEAWYWLGRCLMELGRWTEACQALDNSTRMRGDHAEAHLNHGKALIKMRRLEEAVRAFRRAITLNPEGAEALELMGLTYVALERSAEARMSFRRALEIDPDRAEIHFRLGEIHRDQGASHAAASAFRRATEIDPENVRYLEEYAVALAGGSQLDAAIEVVDRLFALEQNSPQGHLARGWTRQQIGDKEGCIADYKRCLELRPGYTSAYHRLAREGAFDDAARIHELLETDMSVKHRTELLTTLGYVYEHAGEYEKAWEHFVNGNSLLTPLAGYDRDKERELLESTKKHVGADLMSQLHGMGDPNHMPVFVVGMPRSGTSLVEQILVSHPQVSGVGEQPGISYIASNFTRRNEENQPYPMGLRYMGRDHAVRAAAEYLKSIEAPSGDYERLVDKTPQNYIHLGLISLIFPNARIIHIKRNPLDTCISNFTTSFGPTRVRFSLDLEDLTSCYEDYERYMKHWNKVLPVDILEVNYEDLVTDTEAQSRRMIEHLGLNWDDSCLDFHRSRRVVNTASNLQVRQPTHTRSIEKWRKYEPWLGPLSRLRRDA